MTYLDKGVQMGRFEEVRELDLWVNQSLLAFLRQFELEDLDKYPERYLQILRPVDIHLLVGYCQLDIDRLKKLKEVLKKVDYHNGAYVDMVDVLIKSIEKGALDEPRF